MPITQDRVIALLSEAFAWKDYAEALHDYIRRSNDYPENFPLLQLCADALALDRPKADAMGLERGHFRAVEGRNAANRRRMANRRVGLPNGPTTAPRTLANGKTIQTVIPDGLSPERQAQILREIEEMEQNGEPNPDETPLTAEELFHKP